MANERPADNFLDVRGKRSKLLFARHKETGHRISARRFYSLPGEGNERDGYVLMTTAPQEEQPKRRAERPSWLPLPYLGE